jgi:hypothetical protein
LDRFGLLPPDIRANIERDEAVETQLGLARQFNRELKKISSRLDLVWVNERADAIYGWIPGRWHIRVRGSETVDTYRPIVTETGGYREPSLYDLEALKRDDLQNPRSGAWERLDPDGEQMKKDTERSRRLAAEQRRDEIAENSAAIFRLPGEGGMTKRLWGKGKPLKGISGSS